MSAITLHISGQPVGKGRPRATSRGGKVRTYTPDATREAEARIAAIARAQGVAPLDGPLRVVVVASFEPAPSWSAKRRTEALGKPHTQRPDADNIGKLIADALNGIAWADDAQIADLRVIKRWAALASVLVTVEVA